MFVFMQLIFEREQPACNLPQTSALANQYVESGGMTIQNRPNSDKPASGKSMRRAFTHYIFGPASTPPFKVKSPTFNGFGRMYNEASKAPKSHQLPPVTPKSSSSSSHLSKLPDTSRKAQSESVDMQLLDYPASAKSNLT